MLLTVKGGGSSPVAEVKKRLVRSVFLQSNVEYINDDSDRVEMQKSKARLVRSGFMLSGDELVALTGGELSIPNT
ncbi:TPA: hypothetical protein LVL75_001560 [Klebsiella oxytoca]|nr:hypothetical protein [Klebsiella oxytoca]